MGTFFHQLKNLFLRFFRLTPEYWPDPKLSEAYSKAGATFGDAASCLYMGECIGFADLHAEWESLEIEWAKRGYRTHSIDEFIDLGGYNRPLKDLGARRAAGEEPVYHAKIYRELYLGKIKAAVTIDQLMNGPIIATYPKPSTELEKAPDTSTGD